MIHNGIEYGIMQAYAEGFDIMKNKNKEELPGRPALRPQPRRYRRSLAPWQRRRVLLLDLTAIALAKSESLSEFSGSVSDSGEGRWTIEAAIEEAVPCEVLSASLYARFPLSSRAYLRREAALGDAIPVRRPCRAGHQAGGPRMNEMPIQTGKKSKGTTVAPPCVFVIFGASGDLTKRLLMPAVYNLVNEVFSTRISRSSASIAAMPTRIRSAPIC